MSATFSPCRRYRYDLWRRWGMFNPHPGYVLFVGLNPSTADETLNDPTIRRCIGFAKTWGFNAYCMANLFAWRDTKPQGMKAAADPVGPDNDPTLLRLAIGAGKIICAWGTHGTHRNRQAEVMDLFAGLPLLCLSRNEQGTPKHPLYVRADAQPFPFAP